ncbi:SDR family NAD(P)-dependent oxidoreductase [Rummeliibacillus suwonensis]|uniref:SDR family NAD(P)-dependent oxidoreductase n=1 Tax=Rummeliibacillus suwonensis TaxID=1306154 RepID=UPI001FB8BFB7|nr:SDR family NAD(P)-dependent oxidoreductase [Rummeliibacillus suwonensis]
MRMVYIGMLKNKTILITGATSGVGQIIANKLAEKGHHVIATGRNKKSLNELATRNIVTIPSDLSSPLGVHHLIKQLPRLDIAIFSAGIGTFEYVTEMEDEDLLEMLHVNVQAPMLLTKYIAQRMKEQKHGQLIFIGSQAGKIATPKAAVYAATKHAMIGYTNALRLELAPYHIHVTCIHPGPIDTPFIDHADKTASYKQAMKHVLLQPEKVANATIRTIGKTTREVNLPKYMWISSKLYTIAPGIVEKVGKRFFYKK